MSAKYDLDTLRRLHELGRFHLCLPCVCPGAHDKDNRDCRWKAPVPGTGWETGAAKPKWKKLERLLAANPGYTIGYRPFDFGIAIIDIDQGDPQSVFGAFPPLERWYSISGEPGKEHGAYWVPDGLVIPQLGGDDRKKFDCVIDTRWKDGYVVLPPGAEDQLERAAERAAEKPGFGNFPLALLPKPSPNGNQPNLPNPPRESKSTLLAPADQEILDRIAAHPAFRFQSKEWKGPCPRCGTPDKPDGDDRLWVSAKNGRLIIRCRPCGVGLPRLIGPVRQMLGLPVGRTPGAQPEPQRPDVAPDAEPPEWIRFTEAADLDPNKPLAEPVVWMEADNRRFPLLRRGDVLVLGGAGGASKTTLAAQLCATAGHAHHNNQDSAHVAGIDALPGNTALVLFERRQTDYINRFIRRTTSGKGLFLCNAQPLITEDDLGVRPFDHWNTFWDHVAALEPTLVVLDPAGSALDVESPDAARPVRKAISLLYDAAERTNAGIILLAHSTKAARYGADAIDKLHPDAIAALAIAGSREWHDSPGATAFLYNKGYDDDGNQTVELFVTKANAAPSKWAVRYKAVTELHGRDTELVRWDRQDRLTPRDRLQEYLDAKTAAASKREQDRAQRKSRQQLHPAKTQAFLDTCTPGGDHWTPWADVHAAFVQHARDDHYEPLDIRHAGAHFDKAGLVRKPSHKGMICNIRLPCDDDN